MKVKIGLVAILSIVFVLIPIKSFSQPSKQCDWWGRLTYPICTNKNRGREQEYGKKYISETACINGQPEDRGGIVL